MSNGHFNTNKEYSYKDFNSYFRLGSGEYDSNGKIICRTQGLTKVHDGNHGADILLKAKKTTGNIKIYHYPVRSYELFEMKVINGGKSLEQNKSFKPSFGAHWRHWYELYKEGRLREVFDGMSVIDDETAKKLIGEGSLMIDNTMVNYFHSESRINSKS